MHPADEAPWRAANAANAVDAAVVAVARCDSARAAVHFGGRILSYGDLDRLADQVACAIARVTTPGTRIAYLGRNSDSCLVLLLAAMRTGTCLVPVNWRLSAQEIAFVLADSEAQWLFVEPEFALHHVPGGTGAGTGPAGVILSDGLATLTGWAAAQAAAGQEAASLPPYDPAAGFVQLYTSGTTGFPKGVVITNERYSIHVARLGADPARWWIGTRAQDVVLVAMPMFHVSGCGIALEALAVGATIVLLPAFDAPGILHAIGAHRVTRIFLVPAALRIVLELPAVATADLRCLETLMYGGSPITPDLQALADRHLRCRFVHCYGMTEAGGNICVLEQRCDDPEVLRASVGRAIPGTEVRIADPSGRVLPAGFKGEVQLRSPTTFAGYWHNPAATTDAYTADGWMHTGDIGYQDDTGHLFLLDRLGDLIISGGENIYPVEVERLLALHDDIADVAVIGLDHPHWGQVVTACVVPRSGATLTLAAIHEWLDGRLARYKLPRVLHVTDLLPRNAAGKVRRAALREALAEARHVASITD